MVRSCLKGLFHCSIVLIAWGLLAPSTAIAKEQDEGPCHQGFAKIVFAPEHFALPSSRDDIDPSTHPVFAESAAKYSNDVLDSLGNGIPIHQIFAALAKKRYELAVKMNTPMSEEYGKLRAVIPDSRTDPAMSHVTAKQYLPLMEKYRLIDLLGYLGNNYRTSFATQMIYSFKRHRPASEVAVLEDKDLIVIQHPEPQFSKEIFEDVILRAEALRKISGTKDSESKKEFLRIVDGFFDAMPYKRGSGAIGRIFFEAFYSHAFGTIAHLPPDIDYLALILDEENFVSEMAIALSI